MGVYATKGGNLAADKTCEPVTQKYSIQRMAINLPFRHHDFGAGKQGRESFKKLRGLGPALLSSPLIFPSALPISIAISIVTFRVLRLLLRILVG